jgi:hypothetical protein
MASLVVLTLVLYLLFYRFTIHFLWFTKTLTRVYKVLPEHLRLCWDFIDEIVNGPIYTKEGEKTRPWIAQHLTEAQWRQHRRSFKHCTRHIGEYANFHGGTIGWLKREGLPPVTPEMQEHLNKRAKQYEEKLLAAGMITELAEWRERNRERQAVIEAIGA